MGYLRMGRCPIPTKDDRTHVHSGSHHAVNFEFENLKEFHVFLLGVVIQHEMWDSYLPTGGRINIYMLHVYAVTTVMWSSLSVDTCLYHTVTKASTDFLISLTCNRCNLINSAVIPPSDLEIH